MEAKKAEVAFWDSKELVFKWATSIIQKCCYHLYCAKDLPPTLLNNLGSEFILQLIKSTICSRFNQWTQSYKMSNCTFCLSSGGRVMELSCETPAIPRAPSTWKVPASKFWRSCEPQSKYQLDWHWLGKNPLPNSLWLLAECIFLQLSHGGPSFWVAIGRKLP